jgi:hypothetical protein
MVESYVDLASWGLWFEFGQIEIHYAKKIDLQLDLWLDFKLHMTFTSANFVITFDKLQKTLVINDMMWQCHVT